MENEKEPGYESSDAEVMSPYNVEQIKTGKNNMRNKLCPDENVILTMCSGCKGLFAKSYKSRHQLTCSGNSLNLIMPVISIENMEQLPEECFEDFEAVLSTLHLKL